MSKGCLFMIAAMPEGCRVFCGQLWVQGNGQSSSHHSHNYIEFVHFALWVTRLELGAAASTWVVEWIIAATASRPCVVLSCFPVATPQMAEDPEVMA